MDENTCLQCQCTEVLHVLCYITAASIQDARLKHLAMYLVGEMSMLSSLCGQHMLQKLTSRCATTVVYYNSVLLCCATSS